MICQSNISVPQENCSQKASTEDSQIEDFPLARFMRFLKQLAIHQILRNIKDPRDPNKTRHRIDTILLWALTVFFFRCESTNTWQQAFEKLPLHKQDTLLNYFGLEKGAKLPDRTIVNYCLDKLDIEELNAILVKLTQQAIRRKIFYNHIAELLPDNHFYISFDGYWLHRYEHPHACDMDGNNTCPYCLPRIHNKGTDQEYIDYLHVFVTVVLIFPNSMKLPLYVYPLKAVQLQEKDTSSDAKLKQECELQAVSNILPKIKEIFPKLQITVLGDSLYANAPLLKLVKDLGWRFLIVRQQGSLKTLAKRCDTLAKSSIYEAYTHVERYKKIGLERLYRWFNGEFVGETEVNVLRFEEIEYTPDGKVKSRFTTEWLCSEKINKSNCSRIAQNARRRADHEDMHNTLKNRGFAAKHDYARKRFNGCLVWKILMFVAFWIFELFSYTTLAQESKNKGSWIALAKELFADLLKVSWDILKLSPSLQKKHMQFRYKFT